MSKKILIAQGGGPTMVINKSLVGVIEEAKKNNFKILGSFNGVRGIIDSNFINLNNVSNERLKLIEVAPGAALGSTRDKPDVKYCNEITKILKKKNIDTFFYIGGNDSSDSLRLIANQSEKLQCIHIPKTIDNDLVLNDHTPGYGSAAKYVASVFAGINLDINSLPGVYIGIVMGRHAGFLTAASSLLRKSKNDGPHLIYLPESNFSLRKFLDDVNEQYQRNGKCIIAVSEGIKDSKGQLIGDKFNSLREKDAHGNVQLSGTGSLGDFLSNQVKEQLSIKRVRADTLGYAQRSFIGCISEVDQSEAKKIGKKAIQFARNNASSFSISIKERKNFNDEYKIKIGINRLENIGGKTKYMPKEFINSRSNNVTQIFKNYALPLIGKKLLNFTSSI